MVYPAHAGIDPRFERSPGSPPCLPRARGDRPVRNFGEVSKSESTPRTRGSTSGPCARPKPSPVYPAHAGIDRTLHTIHGVSHRLPRARGDRPLQQRRQQRIAQSTPRTRGSTCRHRATQYHVVVYPAHAGIDLGTTSRRRLIFCLPRARGDRPPQHWSKPSLFKSTPRTRGSTISWGGVVWYVDVYPAHAGIDLLLADFRHAVTRLPRARGDRPSAGELVYTFRESTPRTRGSTCTRQRRHRTKTVYPAHAGIDPTRSW